MNRRAFIGTTVVGSAAGAAAADGALHFWRLADGRHLKAIATGTFYLGGVVVSDGYLFAADMAGVVRAYPA